MQEERPAKEPVVEELDKDLYRDLYDDLSVSTVTVGPNITDYEVHQKTIWLTFRMTGPH